MGGAGGAPPAAGQQQAPGTRQGRGGIIIDSSQVQTVTDPKLLCTVSGRVTSAMTGEPLPRATVSLMGGGPGTSMRSARTDADGQFTIERVQPGVYRLVAEKVGYLQQVYGARSPGGAGAQLTLSTSQTVTGIDLRLTPQGVISGTVYDDEGEPLPRAMVGAFPPGGGSATLGGRRLRRTAVTTTTNDMGEFRLFGLSPGKYIIVASSQGRIGARGGMGPPGMAGGMRAGDPAEQEDLMPTYYPSTTDADSAAAVEVAAGQEVAGISIMLRKGSMYRVQGKVVGVASQDLASIRLMLVRRGAAAGPLLGGNAGAVLRTDGSFEFARVWPGAYFVTAERMGQNTARLTGKTPVEVASGDVRDVVVTLAEPLTLSGVVRIEGAQTADTQRLMVSLNPLEETAGLPGFLGGSLTARLAGASSFKILEVPPDSYYLNFMNLPEGAYVKSIRLNNQEVLDKGLDLTGVRGAAMIDITLSLKAASLEGTVTDGEQPAGGSVVVVLPDPLRPSQPYLNLFLTADQEGGFRAAGLPPGAYKLYAFPDSEAESAQDLDYVRSFESRAVSVTLEEEGKGRVDLKLLKPEDARR